MTLDSSNFIVTLFDFTEKSHILRTKITYSLVLTIVDYRFIEIENFFFYKILQQPHIYNIKMYWKNERDALWF